MTEIARVFIGTDRSQWIGVKVLEFSIHKHSSIPVEVRSMADLKLPEPSDPRHSQRTGFSFSRFAIPELAGYHGRAVYLDADMLVFKDFAYLWNIPFAGAKVVIQENIPGHLVQMKKKGAPDQRIKQCSVMLLDCDRLDWNPQVIISKLGKQYTYDELVYQLCILNSEDISYRIPYRWNSLEHFDADTCLLHYTDMYTQPWVAPENEFGYLWIRYLHEMLTLDHISLKEIEREIELGYARPSLLVEMQEIGGKRKPTNDEIERYQLLDDSVKFVRHKAVYEAKNRRKEVIKEYEHKIECEKSSSQLSLTKSRSLLKKLLS